MYDIIVNMILRLENIAFIQSGYHFKSKTENDSFGSIRYIQLKDIAEDNMIKYKELWSAEIPNIKQNQFLDSGDVLIKCRGSNFTSSVFRSDNINTIASSHFFVLKTIREDLISPEYLSWFLNDVPTQRIIKKGTGGTYMQVLNKNYLENLEIKIPIIEIQQKLVKLKSLNEQEQKILKKKVELGKLLNDLQLRKIINKF